MDCAGAISLIELMNFFIGFVYFYFCAVAYEYSVRGTESPGLIAKDAVRKEKERAAKEKK